MTATEASTVDTTAAAPVHVRRRRSYVRPLAVVVLAVLLALLPELALSVPGLLPGPTYSPGTLQLLAVCMLVGALAVTYDLLFAVTGLLSFGHALFFAFGCYLLAVLLQHGHLALLPAAALTLAAGLAASVLIGLVCLRVSGIAFAMVTLAFAQAGSVLVLRNAHGLTGGEEGLGLTDATVPAALLGVANTDHLYWLSLGAAGLTLAVVGWSAASRAGHVMAAVRENELRVRVLGIRPYVVRLLAFSISGTLATLLGMVYLLVLGGASPRITTSSFTLTLLVMVVLGGLGSRWGAMLGGVLYTLADQRLGVLASSDHITTLPALLRVPLSQPAFLLGVLFVVVVLFLPGGITGTLTRAVGVSGGWRREPAVLGELSAAAEDGPEGGR
jgi:branched-chain amino acid transport system permease protein